MATIIKKVKCINDTDRWDLLASGRTYNVTKVIDNYAYILGGVKYMHSMDRFEDVIEGSEKELKKVRCIESVGMSNLENGKIYEVESQYDDCSGRPLYRLIGVAGSKYASRFEDVIEPEFKVGDKVVFAREAEGNLKMWNFVFKIGNTYTVKGIGDTGNVLADNGYFMAKECFDLAPEPKPEPTPQFKTGDWVRVTKELFFEDKPYIGTVAKIIEVRLNALDKPFYLLENVTTQRGGRLSMNESQLELAEEPKPLYQTYVMGEWLKPEVKERAIVKKVRCIDATCSRYQLQPNKIYEVEEEGTTSWGTKYYIIKGGDGTRFVRNRFMDVADDNYPQIVYLADGTKVVFNPPYTIVECNGLVGKVKCYHKDEYTKWGGYVEALKVMKPCLK